MHFLASILTLNKVASFHNEAHTFLYQKKLGTNFLTIKKSLKLQ